MEQPIRILICGQDPKNGFAFVVGQKVYGGGEIHAIAVDGRAEQLYGRSRYLIYVENEEGIILWKAVDGLPVTVEYDIDLG